MLKRGLVRCSIIKIENGLKRNSEKEKNMPKEAPECKDTLRSIIAEETTSNSKS